MANIEIQRLNGGYILYVCPKDGTILIEMHDDGTWNKGKSCKHFKWETRTYEQLPVTDSDVVLDIIKDKKVYVLKPR